MAFIIQTLLLVVGFLMLVNILMLVEGMFIDGSSAIIITAPLLYTVATGMGIDPIHFGVIMVANASIGMFTPPFGLNLFVAAGVTKIPVAELSRKVWVWIILSLIALMLITYIPQLSLFMPGLI